MLEDYVVEVNTPVVDDSDGGFVLGWQYGYNQGPNESIRYWDGQDIWLRPGQSGLRAAFRGTLRFVNDGDPVHVLPAGAADDLSSAAGFPAIGPALVLSLLPQDFLKLGDLLTEGSAVPKAIVYQNVDKTGAIAAAKVLIDDPEYREKYKRMLTQESDEGDISDEVFAERANRWVDTRWAAGLGMGILVRPGALLGEAAVVPAASADYPADAEVVHFVPDGAAGWNRLTLKVVADEGLYFNPCFLFYLLQGMQDPSLVRPGRDNSFVAACCNQLEALPVVTITNQLREGWSEAEAPDEQMPPALPDVRLLLVRADSERAVSAIFDPALETLWRVQSQLFESNHRWRFLGPQLFAQCLPDLPFSDSTPVHPQPPPQPTLSLGVSTTNWLTFTLPDGTRQKRFILGANMEACRRKNNHDLSGNDILYTDNYPLAQGEDPSSEVVLSYSDAWLDAADNRVALRWDLESLARTGVRAIRVWVFESLEGLHFSFTSQLLEERRRANHLTSQFLTRVEFDNRVFHVCTRDEFQDLKNTLSLRVEPADEQANALWRRLVANARFLQEEAANVRIDGSAAGLRVLWTLFVQYGEGVIAPATEWWPFIQQASVPGSGHGRLPVEAWIYRELFSVSDASFRNSYIDNALKPFVRAMEAAGGETLGYEVLNEPDILWDDCRHRWTQWIAGPKVPAAPENLPTDWKMTDEALRTFVRDCAEGVRSALSESHHEDKLVVSSIQTTWGQVPAGHSYVDHLHHELDLLRPGSDHLNPANPPLSLSASGITRYATEGDWKAFTPLSAPAQQVTLPVPGDDHLRRHGQACLITEAGDTLSAYDCTRQKTTVSEILSAALRRGYAGVFLWHYNDPERAQPAATNARQQNALTEGGRWVAGTYQPWTVAARRSYGRVPGCTVCRRQTRL